MSEHQHHHRRSRASKLRQFLRTYRFEIVWLIVVALGIFLIFERLSIRSSLAAWLRRGVDAALHGAGHLNEVAGAFLAQTTLSDVLGYVLILVALLAIYLRVRWRIIHSPKLTDLRCPHCGGAIHRSHRRAVDRFISLFVPVRRYRCANDQCRWYGLRVGTSHGSSRAPARNPS